MAAVDLYGGDAERIRNQYKTSLGRDASDDEVSGWLSGSFGGGGVNDWVNQIGSSDEARRRNPAPPVLGQNPQNNQPLQPQTHQQAPADDPWARARSGIENTYQQFLGRQASGDEVNNWLSGGYGYGGGLENYDKYINAIMGSHEARAYRPPVTTQDNGYKNIEWWQQRGTPTTDIFDPMTGQLRAGWQRTGNGYERIGGAPTTNATPNVPGPQGGNYQQWFQQLTQGKPISPQTLVQLEPILNQHGIRLGPKNARGFTDGIILPDGTFIDVIMSATENGGSGWGWIRPNGMGGGGAPGDQYNDPYTQFLEQVLKGRFGQLGQGVDDPYRQQLLQAYQQRAASLNNAAEPAYQALIQRLNERVTDLKGPGYTGAENEVLRTQALDPIENDRAAAKKRVTEQLAARGLTLDSGVAQQALLEVDKAFDGMRATSQTTLAATDLQRREGRQQRADAIQGTLYDIPQARAREQLDVMQAVELLESVMRQEGDARSREQLSVAGALSDLGPQRLQLAMQAAGMGGNPNSNFASLMQLANLNQQSQLMNMQRSQQQWSGLGELVYTLMNAGR